MRISIVQNCITPPAIIWQKPAFSNEEALSCIRNELCQNLQEKEVKNLLGIVKVVCKRLNIQVKDLPINEVHKGNLTPEQNFTVYEEILNAAVFNRKA